MSSSELITNGFAAEEPVQKPKAWYEIGIFSLYNFASEHQSKRPAPDVNIRGECSECKKSISARAAANGNFTRHFKVFSAVCAKCTLLLRNNS